MKKTNINGWLFIDKPIGVTSFYVIKKIKKFLDIKKIGHSGTLDPLASGVLGIAIGEATKSIDYLNNKKEYEFNVTFGESKTTEDLEGETLDLTKSIPNKKEIIAILKNFLGIIEQDPPKHSAIKINGIRSYNLARKSLNFETKKRKVVIYDLIHIKQLNEYTHKFKTTCSSGTYIRSIGRDIAIKLNSLGYISFLRRTRISKISEKKIISLDNLIELVHIGNHFKMVQPIESVLDDIPAVYLNRKDTKRFRDGQVLNIFASSSNISKLLVLDKEVVGIGKVEEGTLVPIRMFNI